MAMPSTQKTPRKKASKATPQKPKTAQVIEEKKITIEQAEKVISESTDHLLIENTGASLLVPAKLMIFAEGLADLYKGQKNSEFKKEKDSAKNALTLLKALVGRPRIVKGEIITNGIGRFSPSQARSLGDRAGYNLVISSSITSTTYGS